MNCVVGQLGHPRITTKTKKSSTHYILQFLKPFQNQ